MAVAVQGMYEDGVPFLSGLLFAVADWVKAYWWGCVAAYLVAVGAVIWVFTASPRSNDPLRRCVRALPGAERILFNYDMARASGVLAALVRRQTPLDQALGTAADLADSPTVGRALRELADSVRAGTPVGVNLSATRVLAPLFVCCLTHFPEKELPGELEQARQAFLDQANTASVRCAAVWGSVACTAMALIVGSVVITMFLPLVELDRWLHVMG
jgi:type II secretory pathway component PulF